MKPDTQIYEDLRKHLYGRSVNAKKKKSDVEISILRRLYTPGEARIALQLSAKPEPIKKIYERIDGSEITKQELTEILEQMTYHGTAFRKQGGYNDVHYSGAGCFFSGVYAFQSDRLTEDLSKDFYQFFYDTYTTKEEMDLKKRIFEYRTVPVEESIPASEKNSISDYDNVRKMIEGVNGQIVLSHCICRQTKEYQEEFCNTTHLRETCLVIGQDRAAQYLDMGIGRPIDKDEALDIYNKSQDAGLVIQPENTQRPAFICFCCGDCCAVLDSAKKLAHPSKFYATNYYITVDAESCITCGACVDRCPMQALSMVNQAASVDLNRCIGCGNCVTTCGGEALKLKKKKNERIPPKTQEDLYAMII